MGSLINFAEIEELFLKDNYNVDCKSLIEFQRNVVKYYSLLYFGKNINYELMKDITEPYKNVINLDLFETFFNENINKELVNKYPELSSILNDKQVNLIKSILSEFKDFSV